MSDVIYELTPNPQSMKFVVTEQTISDESLEFKDADETDRSPLATKLFGFPWVSSVFVGKDFVTVTKQDWVEWDVLAEPLKSLIQEHIEGGIPVVLAAGSTNEAIVNDSDDVKKIKKIIESEIRPAVSMDGGDVVFVKYEDSIVYLRMKGACSGCPSSTYTLKMGIETRLRESLPEIKEVVAI